MSVRFDVNETAAARVAREFRTFEAWSITDVAIG
jgi:hypothetical protein